MSQVTRDAVDNAIRAHLLDEGYLPEDELLSDWVLVAYSAPVDSAMADGYTVEASNENMPGHVIIGLLHTGIEQVNSAGWVHKYGDDDDE